MNEPHDDILRQLLSRECFAKLRDGVHYAYAMAVAGGIAEFGTGWGRSAYLIAASMAQCEQTYKTHQPMHGLAPRTLHLFDSFQGLPPTTNMIDIASPHVMSGFWREAACKGMTEAELVETCARFIAGAQIKTYAGWFNETLERIPPDEKFAVVHIDCDLYESTRDVLDHLFTRKHFADGCALFFDDWNCNRASPDFGERRAWREMVEKHAPRFTDWGGYDIGGWRFILHDATA